MFATAMKVDEPLLRTSEAGRILEVAADTVRKMIRRGQLVPDAKTVNGESLFFEATLRELKVKRDQEVREGKRRGRPPMSLQKQRRSKTHK